MSHPKTSNLSKTKNKDYKKRNVNDTYLDHTFTSDCVPIEFRDIVKCFFDEAKTIEEYWRMVKIAAYRNNREKETERMEFFAILSFKQLIRNLKLKDPIHNPLAYF